MAEPRWVRRQLLHWFACHARDLPWRRTRDPYAIWVSEVMLQQTQVASVIPYFERFLRSFPSLHALADADEAEVMRLWEGLGYYRRARSLHRAARLLVADHAGEVPNDPQLLHELPGFGRYTVNAVLSQAFDRRLPILEANSRRVLCRLLGICVNPEQPAVEKILWATAETLVPPKRAGAFNQALMELGALICTPVTPQCGRCPLARRCVAHVKGMQDTIPLRGAPAQVVHVDETAVTIMRDSQVLLVRRPDGGRWAGLWEFPHLEQEPLESPDAAAHRLLRALGMRGKIRGNLATIRHAVTRFRITLTCVSAHWRSGEFAAGLYPEGLWLDPADLATYPLSAPHRRLADKFRGAVGT